MAKNDNLGATSATNYPPPPIVPVPKPKFELYIAIVVTAILIVALYIAYKVSDLQQDFERNAPAAKVQSF